MQNVPLRERAVPLFSSTESSRFSISEFEQRLGYWRTNFRVLELVIKTVRHFNYYARVLPTFLHSIKRYRLFGELVSIAIRAGFRLPSLKPPAPPRPMPAGTPQPPPPGLVPANVLHHAGYYFYLSGACAVERRNRFRSVLSVRYWGRLHILELD